MEKYYGILFDRQNIDIGIYLFKPVYIVEGKVKENEYGSSFIDAIDDEYSFMDDSNTILFYVAFVFMSIHSIFEGYMFQAGWYLCLIIWFVIGLMIEHKMMYRKYPMLMHSYKI